VVGQLEVEGFGRGVAEPAAEGPLRHAGMPATLDQRHLGRQGGEGPLGGDHPRRQVGQGHLGGPPPAEADEGRPDQRPGKEGRRHRQQALRPGGQQAPRPTGAPLRGSPDPSGRTPPEPDAPHRPVVGEGWGGGVADGGHHLGGDVGDGADRLEAEPLADGSEPRLEGAAGRAGRQVAGERTGPPCGQLPVGGHRQVEAGLLTAHRLAPPRSARRPAAAWPGRRGS
jgi:hypothetical protein